LQEFKDTDGRDNKNSNCGIPSGGENGNEHDFSLIPKRIFGTDTKTDKQTEHRLLSKDENNTSNRLAVDPAKLFEDTSDDVGAGGSFDENEKEKNDDVSIVIPNIIEPSAAIAPGSIKRKISRFASSEGVLSNMIYTGGQKSSSGHSQSSDPRSSSSDSCSAVFTKENLKKKRTNDVQKKTALLQHVPAFSPEFAGGTDHAAENCYNNEKSKKNILSKKTQNNSNIISNNATSSQFRAKSDAEIMNRFNKLQGERDHLLNAFLNASEELLLSKERTESNLQAAIENAKNEIIDEEDEENNENSLEKTFDVNFRNTVLKKCDAIQKALELNSQETMNLKYEVLSRKDGSSGFFQEKRHHVPVEQAIEIRDDEQEDDGPGLLQKCEHNPPENRPRCNSTASLSTAFPQSTKTPFTVPNSTLSMMHNNNTQNSANTNATAHPFMNTLIESTPCFAPRGVSNFTVGSSNYNGGVTNTNSKKNNNGNISNGPNGLINRCDSGVSADSGCSFMDTKLFPAFYSGQNTSSSSSFRTNSNSNLNGSNTNNNTFIIMNRRNSNESGLVLDDVTEEPVSEGGFDNFKNNNNYSHHESAEINSEIARAEKKPVLKKFLDVLKKNSTGSICPLPLPNQNFNDSKKCNNSATLNLKQDTNNSHPTVAGFSLATGFKYDHLSDLASSSHKKTDNSDNSVGTSSKSSTKREATGSSSVGSDKPEKNMTPESTEHAAIEKATLISAPKEQPLVSSQNVVISEENQFLLNNNNIQSSNSH